MPQQVIVWSAPDVNDCAEQQQSSPACQKACSVLPQQESMQHLSLQLIPCLTLAVAWCHAVSPCLQLQQVLQEQQQLLVSSWAVR